MDIIDSMLGSAVDIELVECVVRRWQLFARTEAGTRKIMQEQIRALEQKCARERIQAEARASLITASEHRHTMAENFLSMLVAERVGWMLRDSFIHWRCVAEGVVLPCLRRKDAFRSVQRALLKEEGDEQRVVFGRFQSARLRRKAFMYWVAQIRDLVIRRMQVEDLLSIRPPWRGCPVWERSPVIPPASSP